MGVRVTDSDRDPTPQGIRWDGDSAGTVDGGKVFGVAKIGGHLGRDGTSATADRIRGPSEVLLAGVGLCAVHHPRHRYGVSGGGG